MDSLLNAINPFGRYQASLYSIKVKIIIILFWKKIMKQNAYIIGVGMTPFGNHLDKGFNQLAVAAITEALKDSGLDKKQLQAAYMGASAAPIITGQVCITGQVALRSMGIGGIPVVNVENACATSATAFQQASTMVTAGLYDVVLAVGCDKLYHEDKSRTLSVFEGGVDVENLPAFHAFVNENMAKHAIDVELDASKRSVFMDLYACMARDHMKNYGSTARHFAQISAKNSVHGSLNPLAQYRNILTADEVLADRMIADPLTLTMCAPIGDGAAAAIIVSERKLRELGAVNPVRILSSVLMGGWDYVGDEPKVTETAAKQAYEEAGIGPENLSCVELHDASSPAELIHYENLGLCPRGEAVRLVEDKETSLGGKIPVNTSGGLNRKGHPIGPTGISQIVELTEQIRGRAGKRQVEGACTGLAENGGGHIGTDVATVVVSILSNK